MLKRFRWHRCVVTVFAILGITYIPTRLAIAQQQAPEPELILVLGGSYDREVVAAQVAHRQPHLKIWVSSGSPFATQIFQQAEIPLSRVYLDRRATDTVTNFTTVVKDLQKRGIRHIYVITSDYHMPRATAIATVVLGSQGITFTSIPVTGEHRQESKLRVLRDVGRSVVWLLTGRTGASFRYRSWLQ